jgi:hypothetical protein
MFIVLANAGVNYFKTVCAIFLKLYGKINKIGLLMQLNYVTVVRIVILARWGKTPKLGRLHIV